MLYLVFLQSMIFYITTLIVQVITPTKKTFRLQSACHSMTMLQNDSRIFSSAHSQTVATCL